jgi:hypothetical protein
MNDSRKISRTNANGPAMNTYEYACNCAKDMYAHFPNSITIEAVVAGASATDQLTFDDFCGLMVDLNVGQGANTLKMDVRGAVSGDSVRNFLSSHAGRIKLINYTCREDADQLTNKIKLVSASIDENTAVHKIFDVATDIRNTQFQDTLQTVYPHKGDAWLTKNSGIVLATNALAVDPKTVSLTIQFDCFLPYAMICG